MLRFSATAALALLAHGAAASTYTYEYQGNDLICLVDDGECVAGEVRRPAFTGLLTVDEDVMPGTLEAATLIFTTDAGDGTGTYDTEYFLGNSAGITVTDNLSSLGIMFDGFVTEALSPLEGEGAYAFQFDFDRQVIDWYGDSGIQGGSNDWFSSPDGDFDGVGGAAPGAWVLTSVVPAPVPLPAGALLLLGGLGALGLMRRRA